MHLQIEAIATLALFDGLRASEIHFIGIDDMHPDNDFIVVRGKSSFGERQGYREVRHRIRRAVHHAGGGNSARRYLAAQQ